MFYALLCYHDQPFYSAIVCYLFQFLANCLRKTARKSVNSVLQVPRDGGRYVHYIPRYCERPTRYLCIWHPTVCNVSEIESMKFNSKHFYLFILFVQLPNFYHWSIKIPTGEDTWYIHSVCAPRNMQALEWYRFSFFQININNFFWIKLCTWQIFMIL